VPDGDLLVYAGDFSMRAKMNDVVEFARWIKSLPHSHKIIIPGNHDVYCEKNLPWTRDEFFPALALNHESCSIAGYRIFGSPYTSSIYEPSPWSFDYPRVGSHSEKLWSQIPTTTDILVTHGPPKGILDYVPVVGPEEDNNVGDVNLLYHVNRVRPKLHLFGHIHEGYGNYTATWGTKFYNVCICNESYRPINPITVLDL
jgi:Icc-related predicted phosphoesterase